MKKEELIKLLRKAYLSGVMEKELTDKMIGFNHDLEGMATNYAEIEVNNVVLDDVSNCDHYWLYPVSSKERTCKKCGKLEANI